MGPMTAISRRFISNARARISPAPAARPITSTFIRCTTQIGTAPLDEVWQAMDKLVRDGKVIYVGSSNFAGWHIAGSVAWTRHHQLLGLVSEQSVYNLANRMVELEVLPACEAMGLGFLAYQPLGGEVLGRTPSEARRRSEPRRGPPSFNTLNTTHRILRICQDLGEPPSRVAMAWVVRRPGVTAALIGPRTLEQFERTGQP